jgi:hypothetical protein
MAKCRALIYKSVIINIIQINAAEQKLTLLDARVPVRIKRFEVCVAQIYSN